MIKIVKLNKQSSIAADTNGIRVCKELKQIENDFALLFCDQVSTFQWSFSEMELNFHWIQWIQGIW